MRAETTERDNGVHVKLSERMAFGDHTLFRKVLTEIRERAPKHCVFDLSGLDSIDSAGLGMLMIARDAAQKEGWSLALRAPQPQVLKLLQLTAFDKVLTIERS